MGVKKSDIIRIDFSDNLKSLLEQRQEIENEYEKRFLSLSEIPIKTEDREEEPGFLGFWVYGDGCEVTITEDMAVVDFEILLNWKTSDTTYTQLEFVHKVSDRECVEQYREYIQTNGRITKRVRKRLQLLAAYAIFIVYDYLLDHQKEFKLDLDEVFSDDQIRTIYKEFRMPKRYSF